MWGLAEVTTPNLEWRPVRSDDSLLVRRYYRTSLLGEFKLYYGGEGLQTETQIRNTGSEEAFLLEAADILREQIEYSGNQVRLINLKPRLYTEPYLAVGYSYYDRAGGNDQFHVERLYFVSNRYWFVDAGCLASEKEVLGGEIAALYDSLDFGEDEIASASEALSPLEGPLDPLSDEALEQLEEFSGDWNL